MWSASRLGVRGRAGVVNSGDSGKREIIRDRPARAVRVCVPLVSATDGLTPTYPATEDDRERARRREFTVR
jgi:hypothetical protein